MAKTSKIKDGWLLYIGAGRCSALGEYIAKTTKGYVLVDANVEVCNFLKYETRNAPHITVVNAAVTDVSKSAKFKIYNLEDMSSLNEPTGLLDIYPGLELKKEILVQTRGFSDVVKSYIPAGSSFDLIIDVCGSEGSIVSELLNGPYLKKLRGFDVFGSYAPLFKDMVLADDILKKFKSKGIEVDLEQDDNHDFAKISGRVNSAHLDRLQLEKRLKALEAQKNTLDQNLLKVTRSNSDLERQLNLESENLSNSKERLVAITEERNRFQEALKTKVAEFEGREAGLLVEQDASAKKISTLEAKLETQKKTHDRNSLKAKRTNANLVKQLGLESKKLSTLEAKLEALNSEYESKCSEDDLINGKLKDAELRCSELKKSLEDSKAAADAKTVELSEALGALEKDHKKSIKYQAKVKRENKLLAKKIAELEKDVVIGQSVDKNALEELKTSMRGTYEAIVDELNHQIFTLTTISKGKSQQIDTLMGEQQRLQKVSDDVEVDKVDLKRADEEIFELKSRLAEREATLKWHKNRYVAEVAGFKPGKVPAQAEEQQMKSTGEKANTAKPDTTEKMPSKVTTVAPKPTVPQLTSTPPRVVIIGSVPRSGGTWVFNVVRGIFEVSETLYASGWHENFEPKSDSKFHVIKVHKLEDYTGPVWKTITNHRLLEKRVASLIRMGWVEDTEVGILNALKHQSALYKLWADRSDLEVKFEHIQETPKSIIENIADLLGLSLTKDQVNRVLVFVEALRPPEGAEEDPVTLLHPKHRVTDTVSNDARVARIMKTMRDQKDNP